MNVQITSIHEGKEINLCGKGFSCKSTMKKHIHSVHEGKKPHGCPICGKAFYKKVKLKEHIENIHEIKELLYLRSWYLQDSSMPNVCSKIPVLILPKLDHCTVGN